MTKYNKVIEHILRENSFKAKKMVFELLDEYRDVLKEEIENLLNTTIMNEGRFKIVRVRVRKGKIQRRKKVSTLKGYTFRGGRLVRMLAKEKRNRKIGAKRGKIKRKAKKSRALMNRRKSLRKLRAAGGRR